MKNNKAYRILCHEKKFYIYGQNTFTLLYKAMVRTHLIRVRKFCLVPIQNGDIEKVQKELQS